MYYATYMVINGIFDPVNNFLDISLEIVSKTLQNFIFIVKHNLFRPRGTYDPDELVTKSPYLDNYDYSILPYFG